MLAKALCISVATLSHALMIRPPKSSRSAQKTKTDKIKSEDSLLAKPFYPYFLMGATLFQGALYLFFMAQSSGRTDREIQQLKELRNWHIVATLLSVGACALRKWSFTTLDRFFTYQLTIRSGHRLVQTGPYKYLLHPSYTGLVGCCISVWTLLWHQGLFDVLSAFLSHIAIPLSVPHHHAMMTKTGYAFGISGGIWVAMLMTSIIMTQFITRIKEEEVMLKEHFGTEWDQHASKRWRLIPFVY
ncbi:hypothetical protein BGZ65_007681 [Modicella reniformis]|uniref:Protein-S-isoprenylcysteine O-methyltransferase n=1 Tax=Modicella reniformis TaxID=1440133 RepID=A0A9P6IJ95_9FUNG|nr:hypothetical protein BGZ65_007681 [Modicella reniformis]